MELPYSIPTKKTWCWPKTMIIPLKTKIRIRMLLIPRNNSRCGEWISANRLEIPASSTPLPRQSTTNHQKATSCPRVKKNNGLI